MRAKQQTNCCINPQNWSTTVRKYEPSFIRYGFAAMQKMAMTISMLVDSIRIQNKYYWIVQLITSKVDVFLYFATLLVCDGVLRHELVLLKMPRLRLLLFFFFFFWPIAATLTSAACGTNVKLRGPGAGRPIRLPFSWGRERQMRRGGKKKIWYLFLILCTQCASVCLPPAIRSGRGRRLMACLVCSSKSAQMLRSGKDDFADKPRVLSVERRDSRPPPLPRQPGAEPYHADENLTPPNLIKAPLARPRPPPPPRSVFSAAAPAEPGEITSSAVSQGCSAIVKDGLVIS